MTTEDLQTRISGSMPGEYIFVDHHDGEVWFSANVRGSHTHMTVSKEQTKDMIAALIRIVEAE